MLLSNPQPLCTGCKWHLGTWKKSYKSNPNLCKVMKYGETWRENGKTDQTVRWECLLFCMAAWGLMWLLLLWLPLMLFPALRGRAHRSDGCLKSMSSCRSFLQDMCPGGSERKTISYKKICLSHVLWKTYVAEGVFRERVLVLAVGASLGTTLGHPGKAFCAWFKK